MSTEKKAVEAAVRTSLHAFVRKTFETLNPNEIFLDNEHIRAMVHALERCAAGECKRLIITLPPRHLKSMTVSVAFPAWVMGRDPSARIMCVSYSDDLAYYLMRQYREVVTRPWFKKAFPGFKLSKKNTEQEIDTTDMGYRLAFSFRGGITGRGADMVIMDDPNKASEAASEAERQYVLETYKNSIVSRLNDRKTGVIILVMQRVHYDDLAGFLLRHGEWEHLNLPAIAEEDSEIHLSDGEIWHRKAGEVLHPKFMDTDDLDEIRDMDPRVFATQFQQNPAPLGGNAIKRDWFKRYEDRPRLDYFDQIVQSWDTAAGDGANASYSVGQTWGIKGGRAFLIKQVRGRFNYPELKAMVLSEAKIFNADRVLIEKASTGHSLLQDLSGRYNHNFVAIPRPKTDKETRCHRASAVIEAGRISIPVNAVFIGEFEVEVFAFPYSKYTDQVDAMSQFILWWEWSRKTQDWPTVDMTVTTFRQNQTFRGRPNYWARNGGRSPFG